MLVFGVSKINGFYIINFIINLFYDTRCLHNFKILAVEHKTRQFLILYEHIMNEHNYLTTTVL